MYKYCKIAHPLYEMDILEVTWTVFLWWNNICGENNYVL